MLGPNVAVLRSALAGLLTETGLVQEPGGWVYDPETDTEVPAMTTIYSGPILVRPRATDPQVDGNAAGQWVVTKYDITLPPDTPVKLGHKVTLTHCTYDPAMVGVEFNIIDVPLDQWQVARYCVAERVT